MGFGRNDDDETGALLGSVRISDEDEEQEEQGEAKRLIGTGSVGRDDVEQAKTSADASLRGLSKLHGSSSRADLVGAAAESAVMQEETISPESSTEKWWRLDGVLRVLLCYMSIALVYVLLDEMLAHVR